MAVTIRKFADLGGGGRAMPPNSSSDRLVVKPEKMKKKRSGHAKTRLSSVPLDMPGRYYAGNVLAVAGFSAMTLNNRIKDGRFPKPHYDGKRRWWTTYEVRCALGL